MSVLVSVLAIAEEVDRSPVDVVVSADEIWLATANQDASTPSLVDIAGGRAQRNPLHETPHGTGLSADQQFLFVTGTHGGALQRFRVADQTPRSMAKFRSAMNRAASPSRRTA